MLESKLKYYCCPLNHDALKLKVISRSKNGKIESGILTSTYGIEYPINNGIPNFIITSKQVCSNSNRKIYERITKPYDVILKENGITATMISQMDSLRYSIFVKTKEYGQKYLKGLVLEIGAGNNYLNQIFNGIYSEWISLDYDIRNDSIDLQGDGQMLPIKSELLDTIISIDVLEHVPDPEKFVHELFRVLKPGGVVILSTPFFFWLHEEPFDYFRFSKYGLRSIFERHGFNVISVEAVAGIVSIGGSLVSILLTKVFKFSKMLLKIIYFINKKLQLNILFPLDKIIDKRKRFAQGHYIVAQKDSK
jgi:SAM-dependent methyltransferase